MSTEEKASRMHTHTVVFTPGSDDEDCLVRAEMGQSTRAIAEARGLSIGQVNYRIKKGGHIGERRFYRDGASPMFKYIYRQAREFGRKRVQRDVAPQFKPFTDR